MSVLSEPAFDQRPEGWSDGAAGYDGWFAPLSRLYVADALDLLALRSGQTLIDVAAGTGAVTLEAVARGVDVTAVDFAIGMVELLRRHLAEAGLTGRVQQMDGQNLEFEDGWFDAGCSMFGLIFFPDAKQGLREIARVVRPGGQIVVGAWDRDRFPLFSCVQAALSQTVPGLAPPRELPPSLRLGSAADLAGLADEAGLHPIGVTEVTRSWKLSDPEQFFLHAASWAPPLRGVFDHLSAPLMSQAAAAFARTVDEVGGASGLETTAVLLHATS
jgi:SAM-dependent methyltransferase